MPYYTKARTIAYTPRLDVAIRAGPVYRFRGGGNVERPKVLTERDHKDVVISVRERAAVNSGSFAWQTATQSFPNGSGRDRTDVNLE